MNFLTSFFRLFFPAPAPKFTPGQTVRLVRNFPPALAELAMYAPIVGIVTTPTKPGKIAVVFDESSMIYHIAPTDLEAVLSEI